jgi:hypothetical protein
VKRGKQTGSSLQKNFDGKNTGCIFAVRSKRAIVLRKMGGSTEGCGKKKSKEKFG